MLLLHTVKSFILLNHHEVNNIPSKAEVHGIAFLLSKIVDIGHENIILLYSD